MKKWVQRIVMSLAMVLLAGGIFVQVHAAEIVSSGTCATNLTWTLDSEGTLTIAGSGAIERVEYEMPWDNVKDNIRSIIIEDGVTGICEYAFSDCSNLTSVIISDTVTGIAEGAFSSCGSLTEVTLSENVIGIEKWTFSDCSSLTSVAIPDSVTSIGKYAFSNCSSLTSIVVPDSVTSIGEYAFSEDSLLQEVTIGGGVTSIGRSAFSGCSSLSDVYITNPSSWCRISFGNSYANPMIYAQRLHFLDENGNEMTDLVLEDSVTEIPDKAFARCSSLTSITIPDSVTHIGDHAFYNCSSLTSVAIPNGVTRIGRSTFYNCSSLTSVTIPDSVTEIGIGAFYNCGRLTSAVIPGSVVGIGESAFKYCSSLVSVVIGEGVSDIGYEAFRECSNLYSVIIPDSVTRIDVYAFTLCSSLTYVSIGDGVTRIGDGVFFGCTALTSVTIGDGLTRIGNNTFRACSKLADVYYSGNKNAWNGIGIGGYNEYLTSAKIHYGHKHYYASRPSAKLEATCTAGGYVEYTCVHGDTYREMIPALDHDWKKEVIVVAPTCEQWGYTARRCVRCDEEEIVRYTEPVGHRMVEVPAVAPTCTENGLTAGTYCLYCKTVGVAQTVVSATGHSYTEQIIAPDCNKQGYTIHTCHCGESYTDSYTPSLSHAPGEWNVLQEPGYLENGKKESLCSRCGMLMRMEIPNNPFADVGDGNRFKTPILWAYYEGITSGKTATTFEPGSDVTRAQFVTFLWRAAGEPEPASQENPFTDVGEGNRFRTAILWAYHEGITMGKTDTTFAPNDICTRAHVVTFLYRFAGSPAAEDVENPFTDVGESNRFRDAILWAYSTGITTGKTATTFSISGACTRAQVVTFLYRYLA